MAGEYPFKEGTGDLAISSSCHDGWVVATVAGEIDTETAPRLSGYMRSLLAGRDGSPQIIVDLGEVAFCDAAGLGVLVGARSHAMRHGGALRLVVPEGPVRRVLRVAARTHDLEVHATLSDALTASASA